ncbi:MAG: hypothetical protein F6K14_26935 [Symploca sp. SIO2C1]|nr:hypothetical protein [Symploca sp. SIO2C1]
MPTLIPAKSGLVGKNGQLISLMVEDIYFAHPTRFAIAFYEKIIAIALAVIPPLDIAEEQLNF